MVGSHCAGCGVRAHLLGPGGAGDHGRDGRNRCETTDRDLEQRDAVRISPGAQAFDATEIVLVDLPAVQPRSGLWRVLARHLAREQPAREREVGNEAETEPLARGQQVALGVALEPRVLALLRDVRQAQSRSDRGCALERPRRVVRRAERAHLAFGDELGDDAERLLERRLAILLVMLVEVDVIGAQPAKRRLERRPDIGRRSAARRSVPHRLAELGREDDLISASLEEPPDQRLAAARVAVDVCGVEERDPGVEGGVDHRARAGLVDAPAEVVAAEADDRDLERAESPRPHQRHVSPSTRSQFAWVTFAIDSPSYPAAASASTISGNPSIPPTASGTTAPSKSDPKATWSMPIRPER